VTISSRDYRKAIHTINSLNNVYKSLDYDITLQMIDVLCWIAEKPGITVKDLMDRTNLSQSSISRNLTALGKWDRHSKPGMDLIEDVEDPVERRRRIYFLTKKGKRFIARMVGALYDVGADAVRVDSPTAQDHVDNTFRARMAGVNLPAQD